jgi:hypothetical protein
LLEICQVVIAGFNLWLFQKIGLNRGKSLVRQQKPPFQRHTIPCQVSNTDQQVTWVKLQPGFKILFKLVNDLQPDEKDRFFLK